MTERPILFSGPLVRAILNGRKTETRRLVAKSTSKAFDQTGRACGWRPVPADAKRVDAAMKGEHERRSMLSCPQSGFIAPRIHTRDDLWVRESWRPLLELDDVKPSEIPIGATIMYEADGAWLPDVPGQVEAFGDLQPSIFLPRWASRITLRVTDVRAERLQAIDEAGAMAEGVDPLLPTPDDFDPSKCQRVLDPRAKFRELWDSINGKRDGASWAANPWVWVIKFEVAEVER